jgi:hypothetical protein
MIKSRSICIAAILATGLIAGCGSSGNHTSAWSKSNIQNAEDELAGAGMASAPLRSCILKYVEARLTPAEVMTKSSGGETIAKAALVSCDTQTTSSSSDHTSEWPGAKTQELENTLTAEGVSNMSCYVTFVESRVGPVEYSSGGQQRAEQVGKEAATNCHPTEVKEDEQTLEAEHKEKEEATAPATTPGPNEEP